MNSYLSLSIFFHLLNKNINNSYLISLFWELKKIMYIKRSTELNQLLGSICYYYVRYFFPSVWSEIWGDKKQRKTKQNFSPPQNCLLTASERADIATAVWAMLKEAELSLSRVTLFELFLFLPFPLWSNVVEKRKRVPAWWSVGMDMGVTSGLRQPPASAMMAHWVLLRNPKENMQIGRE